MVSIIKKELIQYLGAWSTYIIACIFVVVCSLFLWFFENNYNFFMIGNASMQSFFNLAPWLLMFLIPALSMKSIAEEQQQRTLQWLFSQPVSLTSIVLGKFISLLTIVIFCLLPTLVYLYSLKQLSLDANAIDIKTVFSGYLGLILLSIGFAAIGIFSSSLSQNQLLAYIVGVFLCLLAYYGLEGLANFDLIGNFDYYVKKIGFLYHYKSFAKGIIDTRDVSYFLCVGLIFVFGSIIVIQKKK